MKLPASEQLEIWRAANPMRKLYYVPNRSAWTCAVENEIGKKVTAGARTKERAAELVLLLAKGQLI